MTVAVPYIYRARIISVYDGDTMTAEIDLGFYVSVKHKLRLLGIDTPELRGSEREQGLQVRDYVRGLVLDQEVVIETLRDRTGKYGRYLAIVKLPTGESLNDHLLETGHAVRWI